MNAQNPSLRVSGNFTKDFLDAVKDMPEAEMRSMLRDLSTTRYWVAIVKYNIDRMSLAQEGLYTLDPFKDQTQMARYQGILSGLTDLQDAVVTLQRKSDQEAAEKENAASQEPELKY